MPCPNGCPYARGRFVITPLDDGRFTTGVTRGADKWPSARSRPNDWPATRECGGAKEARMTELSPELTRKTLQPAMHQKLLPRAAELVHLVDV